MTFYSSFLCLKNTGILAAVQIAPRREKPTKTWQTFALAGACLESNISGTLFLWRANPQHELLFKRMDSYQSQMIISSNQHLGTTRLFSRHVCSGIYGICCVNTTSSLCVSGERCTIVIWLILPVVICLSQRLSHACLSVNNFIL